MALLKPSNTLNVLSWVVVAGVVVVVVVVVVVTIPFAIQVWSLYIDAIQQLLRLAVTFLKGWRSWLRGWFPRPGGAYTAYPRVRLVWFAVFLSAVLGFSVVLECGTRVRDQSAPYKFYSGMLFFPQKILFPQLPYQSLAGELSSN